ncbi:unnamed protein product [Prunus armeniaca]|uniref:Uncharacterized protein n=1 Tax=Prunus armeniaca TaxID=36596 RepID=A0A6J5XD46_PRUAR|nr:unnamed protein product [Prunus armeniaca]
MYYDSHVTPNHNHATVTRRKALQSYIFNHPLTPTSPLPPDQNSLSLQQATIMPNDQLEMKAVKKKKKKKRHDIVG